jgi:L-serine deaminase
MSTNTKPDMTDLIRWLRDLTDPVEGLQEATLAIDEARSTLLPELAAIRRAMAAAARDKLVSEQGLSLSEATRELARLVGASPQTVMRLIGERSSYGG